MHADQLLESVAIGISIAAVPGPVFLELTRRTLESGFSSGASLALGEFTGNLIVLTAAYFGVGGLMSSMPGQLALSLGGAAILIWLGIAAWRSTGVSAPPPGKADRRCRRSVSTGLALALLSPVTVALWVFLSGAYLRQFPPPVALLHISLIASGFLLFFVPLAATISHTKNRISPAHLSAVAKIFGTGLILFGISLTIRFGDLAAQYG